MVFDGTRGSRFVGDPGLKDDLIAGIDREGKLDPAFTLQTITLQTIDASDRCEWRRFVD